MSKLRDTIEMKYKMVRSAFRAIDEDASGHLSKDEIVNAVQHFALPIPITHIHEIFEGMGAPPQALACMVTGSLPTHAMPPSLRLHASFPIELSSRPCARRRY